MKFKIGDLVHVVKPDPQITISGIMSGVDGYKLWTSWAALGMGDRDEALGTEQRIVECDDDTGKPGYYLYPGISVPSIPGARAYFFEDWLRPSIENNQCSCPLKKLMNQGCDCGGN
jgi:hypothetical protein